MSVETVDHDMTHLFPVFADAVKKILAQATLETKGKHGADHWIMFEGFRSQGRQDWLYAQGRTRPGDIVTHIQVSNHTSGMAADCYPVDAHGDVMWEAHSELWQQFGHCVRSQPGIQWGGDYKIIHPGSKFVDQPHVELNSTHRTSWEHSAHNHLKGLGLI